MDCWVKVLIIKLIKKTNVRLRFFTFSQRREGTAVIKKINDQSVTHPQPLNNWLWMNRVFSLLHVIHPFSNVHMEAHQPQTENHGGAEPQKPSEYATTTTANQICLSGNGSQGQERRETSLSATTSSSLSGVTQRPSQASPRIWSLLLSRIYIRPAPPGRSWQCAPFEL